MVILLDAARMTLYSFLIKKPSFKKRQTTMPHKNFPTVASSAASRDDMSCCPENSDIVIEYIMQVHIGTWTGRTSHAYINVLQNLLQQNIRRIPRYAANQPSEFTETTTVMHGIRGNSDNSHPEVYQYTHMFDTQMVNIFDL